MVSTIIYLLILCFEVARNIFFLSNSSTLQSANYLRVPLPTKADILPFKQKQLSQSQKIQFRHCYPGREPPALSVFPEKRDFEKSASEIPFKLVTTDRQFRRKGALEEFKTKVPTQVGRFGNNVLICIFILNC